MMGEMELGRNESNEAEPVVAADGGGVKVPRVARVSAPAAAEMARSAAEGRPTIT